MARRALLRAVRRLGLLRSGERGGVAFSGGGDSLCLVHILAGLRTELGIELVALHVDHGLRPESPVQALEVERIAREIGVDFRVARPRIERSGPGNLQERAREARYRALAQLAEGLALRWVATGHTATDQAELVLMRAVRGAGPTGLAGMRWTRPLSDTVRLVRPLLGTTRAQVQAYLTKQGMTPVEDPTNQTDIYLRNRVRRQVLPLLRLENPRVEQALSRLAWSCQEESEALDHLARQELEAARTGSALSLEGLRDLPPGLLHRVLRLAHETVVGPGRRLGRRHVEQLAALVRGQGGSAALDLPGARVVRCYDSLEWGTEPPPLLVPVRVEGPGVVEVAGLGRVSFSLGPASGSRPCFVLSASRVGFPLVLRPAAAGDRIAIDADHRSRVSRVLIDAKVPRPLRGSFPVVTTNDQVAMVVGLRRAWGLGPRQGEEALVVQWEKWYPAGWGPQMPWSRQ